MERQLKELIASSSKSIQDSTAVPAGGRTEPRTSLDSHIVGLSTSESPDSKRPKLGLVNEVHNAIDIRATDYIMRLEFSAYSFCS